jgi:hypothetical protein
MSTVAQIRTALAAAVNGVGGLPGYARYPGQFAKASMVVRRRGTRYGATFNGRSEMSMAVSIYVPLADLDTAQDTIDAALSETGTASVPAALQVDPSFGGVVRGSTVTDAVEEGQVEISGIPYLVATVNLTVRNT